MLKLLIADDNFQFVESLFNKLERSNLTNIKIAKILSKGNDVLKCILNNEIDVVLLDLQMPKLNGLQILEKLKDYPNCPKIIVISGEKPLIYQLLKKNLPVHSIFSKPFNLDELIEVLVNIIAEEKVFINDKKRNIIRLLDNFNFNKASIGYSYIVDCLEICIEEEYSCIPNMKILYSKVARKNNIDMTATIKWNIDKSIKVMNNLTDRNTLNRYFVYNDRPSTKIFLSEILNLIYIENKYEKIRSY